MMKALILGAGFYQLNAIRKAKELGHTVIVSDYLPDSPGKKLADFSTMISTFDVAGNIEVAKQYQVDGVFTIGTDQPVLTAAAVAEELDLPRMISSLTALQSTNKKYMKAVFSRHELPSSRYLLVQRDELDDKQMLLRKLQQLHFPIVIKPIDSQGQRGIFKLYRLDPEVIDYMRQTFSFTRAGEILVEEYYPGDEITVSVWVENHQPYIFMITDRPRLNVEPHLGIPDGHVFPSRYMHSHYDEVAQLVHKLVLSFDIASGPLYVQMILGERGLEIVEIACRIGGGHEDELIPLVCGIDPLDMLIKKSLGQNIDLQQLESYDLLSNPAQAMVKFIVARPGRVKSLGNMNEVMKLPGVVKAAFYNPALAEVKELVNSTCRVGYLLVSADSEPELMQRTAAAYSQVKILDDQDENMIVSLDCYPYMFPPHYKI